MSKAIVSCFYGNSISESQKASIQSFRKNAKDIPYYLIALNMVDSEIPTFCSENGVYLIDPGHIADIRNHTLTRLIQYKKSILEEIREDFVVMVGLDMMCEPDAPFDELDETKINVCIDGIAEKDNAKWMSHLSHRFPHRILKPFSYMNSGFVAFSKERFGEAMESIYEMACTDFYSVAVKDVDCYDSDYVNYFLGVMAAPEDLCILDMKWNAIISEDDADKNVEAFIKHIVPEYDYRILLESKSESFVDSEKITSIAEAAFTEIPAEMKSSPVSFSPNNREAEYNRKYGHLFVDGKYPPPPNINKPELNTKFP